MQNTARGVNAEEEEDVVAVVAAVVAVVVAEEKEEDDEDEEEEEEEDDDDEEDGEVDCGVDERREELDDDEDEDSVVFSIVVVVVAAIVVDDDDDEDEEVAVLCIVAGVAGTNLCHDNKKCLLFKIAGALDPISMNQTILCFNFQSLKKHFVFGLRMNFFRSSSSLCWLDHCSFIVYYEHKQAVQTTNKQPTNQPTKSRKAKLPF